MLYLRDFAARRYEKAPIDNNVRSYCLDASLVLQGRFCVVPEFGELWPGSVATITAEVVKPQYVMPQCLLFGFCVTIISWKLL